MTKLRPLLADILLILILLLGAYLRTVGLNWDGDQHLHPDERFLTMVESAIAPVHSLGEYFDTAHSSLNPANKGFGFFVYGTLPVFIVRYVAEALGKTGYGEVHLVGRELSALADLLLVLLVYGVGKRLYGRKVGLLAAAFSALAVMQIQQSHFFTVDTFFNLFTFAAVAVAVDISLDERPLPRLAPRFLLFGLIYGAAMASKISAFPVAVLLPVALLVRWARLTPAQRHAESMLSVSLLALAGALSLLTFRVFQPYAFRGPHFWNFGLNPQWVDNLRQLKAQASGHADFPPAMQWARRPVWFTVQNLVLWGLGLPLGLSALAALVGMALRLRRRAWTRHIVLWAWTALYLVWQSLIWNPTMRYLLPVYPGLAILAAWGWVRLAETRRRAWRRALAWGGALTVLALTFLWAWAFTRIYTRPHPRIAASRWIYTHIPGPFTLSIQTPDGPTAQPVRADDRFIEPDAPLEIPFTAHVSGTVTQIRIFRLVGPDTGGKPLTLSLEVAPMDDTEPQRVGRAQGAFTLTGAEHPAPVNALLPLDKPVYLEQGKPYRLTVRVDRGAVKVQGAFIANETSWDDGLPLRVDGYDGFGGIYQGLNFEMYWDDNQDKRQRFYDILDQADVLLITSSRQWASLPRLPERFPLVSAYYRHLLGCPAGMSIETCYNIAQVGTFAGDLGYDLVAVFQNAPSVGCDPGLRLTASAPGGNGEGVGLAPLSLHGTCLRVNDQFAEEAFTVYDHPKVFVFRKRADYDPAQVRAVLGAVDLRYVLHVLPGEAPPHPANLLLPPDRLTQQRAGGTWRDLFPPGSPLNRWPGLAAVVWYAFIALLGLLAVPLMRPAFRTLGDAGYPLARLAGMLLFAYGAWLVGSAGVPVGRGTLLGVLGTLFLVSGAAAWGQRKALGAWFRQRKGEILRVEFLFLAFFLLDLFIRWMNPDLWHPWKGGEKPMDFAYFNAVLRSSTFPPYDPWFAGGYINYYYWGFVLVGMPVKLLGIRPEVAYNLILPTLFAGVALGAYGVARYLYFFGRQAGGAARRSPSRGLAVGLAGAVGMVLLGNLGTVQMIFRGLARLASPTGDLQGVGFVRRLAWAALGMVQVLFRHAHLPYGIGDWYWFPSRAIPAPGDVEPITEFPFFTFLYADLHAHMIALGLTLLALAWALAVFVAGRRRREEAAPPTPAAPLSASRPLGVRPLAALFWGALATGMLRATNTWDWPTYTALGMLAVGWAAWQQGRDLDALARLGRAVAAALTLFVAGLLVAAPYTHWYAQGYNKVHLWQGTRTPTSAYLVHWGLFLFVLVPWLLFETIAWLRAVPLVEGLRWWRRWRQVVLGAAAAVLLLAVGLTLWGVHIAWLVLPLAAWAGALLLRPDLPPGRRAALFLLGTGLTLTLAVEVVVLEGDIGRMNTVFKFYFQVWTLFAVSAAAAWGWLSEARTLWRPRLWQGWVVGLALLVWGAALFPVLGGTAKMRDRMAPAAPHTLDGMAYMDYAHYLDPNGEMDLSQDAAAIRWLRAHVDGSPVIVEGNTVEYRWGNRYAIYTGLPAVVGWNWHQRQQRGVVTSPEWVTDRIADVAQFYTTTDPQAAQDFLRRYEVRYIVVGQLERLYYPGPGLDKFAAYNGRLWHEVFRVGETVVYEVGP